MLLFSESEEQIFQQTVEWLSSKFSSSPAFIKQNVNEFHLDPFVRTFNNKNGNIVYLKAKEFDLLYFLMLHKERCSQNNNSTKISGATIIYQT